jgi:hypothetical protein
LVCNRAVAYFNGAQATSVLRPALDTHALALSVVMAAKAAIYGNVEFAPSFRE